jgi:hypothetical protein
VQLATTPGEAADAAAGDADDKGMAEAGADDDGVAAAVLDGGGVPVVEAALVRDAPCESAALLA